MRKLLFLSLILVIFFTASLLLSQKGIEEQDYYSRGKYYLEMRDKDFNEEAVRLFQKAIEKDSQFAPPYIGLALCYIRKVNYGWDKDIEWLNKAEVLLQKADALSPGRADYYHALITIYLAKYLDFNHDTKELALHLAKEALQKHPERQEIQTITGYCFFLEFGETGDKKAFEKAMKLKKQAYYQKPHGKENIVLIEMLLINKDFKEALKICNDLKNFTLPEIISLWEGKIYYYSGKLDKSKESLKQIDMRTLSYDLTLEFLGMIYAREGKNTQAELTYQSIDKEAFISFDSRLRMASILMGLGKEEEGFNQLDIFFNQPYIQKMKYLYERYIRLDKNFGRKIRKKIHWRYYEQKGED